MLAKHHTHIIPYNDLVDIFYLSLNNRFFIPSSPTISLLGYSEITHIVKECFNALLYEIIGNSSYSASLDENLFKGLYLKFKHHLMLYGFANVNTHVDWLSNYIEEIIFPRVLERVNGLRNYGYTVRRADWTFEDGCCLVTI